MLNIKEIALRVAQAINLHYIVTGEMHTNDDWNIRFATALIAEIAKQNEPVAWWNGKETAFFEHETDGPVGEVKIPLYTYPPTAEQIANETAEAIAKFVALQRNDIPATGIEFAEVIRNGAWKEFK